MRPPAGSATLAVVATVKERHLDATDQELLNLIQVGFPIDPQPFSTLGASLGVAEDEVIVRLERLKAERIVRQISMIFDTRALGYRSSLVATRAPDVDAAAAIINEHPGVSHNYRRNHEFNLWWTIAVPPTSSLEDHVHALHEMAGGEATRVMHTIRMFKIGVDLDMTGKRRMDAKTSIPAYRTSEKAGQPLAESEIAVLRELQEDIELIPRPFAAMAGRIGSTEQDVLTAARRFIDEGRARRYAAVLFHRHAGFVANAMSVWQVPEERIDEVGMTMAGFAAVSHCYQRPTYPDWPYNVFGMLHGRTKEDCEEAARAIEEATGVTQRRMLYSTKEYKKIRVRYYTEDLYAWERTHLR